MFGGLFLLRDGTQHIPGPRNVRKVDLGLNFVFAVNDRAGRSGGG
jgi:hypothetical protein